MIVRVCNSYVSLVDDTFHFFETELKNLTLVVKIT